MSSLLIGTGASLIGTLSLILGGFTSWSYYPYLWWRWWVGDSTGVLVVTPLLLTWLRKPSLLWSQSKEQKKKSLGEAYLPKLTIKTKNLGDMFEIQVKDNGIGIPSYLKDKVFIPFFTTKPTGQGTGLGLSLSYDIIIKEHGGKFYFTSEEGEFSEFVISLPIKVKKNIT